MFCCNTNYAEFIYISGYKKGEVHTALYTKCQAVEQVHFMV